MTSKIKICIVPDCNNKHRARGFCEYHYELAMRQKKNIGIEPIRNNRAAGSGGLQCEGYFKITKNGITKTGHVLTAEQVLGRPLKRPELVHHVDGNRANNTPSNLVICPNQAYHYLLHVRQAALEVCGNASWQRCGFCGNYDNPDNMYSRKNVNNYYHSKCKNEWRRNKRQTI